MRALHGITRSFAWGALSGAACVLVVVVAWTGRRRRAAEKPAAPRRFGGAIRLKSNPSHFYDRYTELHDAVWEDVLKRMRQSNMRNFTLYFHPETNTLFSHFEWVGHWKMLHTTSATGTNVRRSSLTAEEEKVLFEADMRAVASDPIVKEWWSQCEPCQEPFSQWVDGAPPPSQGGQGDWWAPLVCLCHCGHWPTEYSQKHRDPDLTPCNPNRATTKQPKLDAAEASRRPATRISCNT